MSEKQPDQDKGNIDHIANHWWNKISRQERQEVVNEGFEKKHPTNEAKIEAKREWQKYIGQK